MLKKLLMLIPSLALGLIMSTNLYAAQNVRAPLYTPHCFQEKIWITAGIDPILLSASHLSLNYVALPNMLISLRTCGVNNTLVKTVTLIGLFDGIDYTNDTGILMGWLYNKDCMQFSASAGLAYVYGGKKASFLNNGRRYSTIGIPLEIQAFWKTFDHLGIGIIGFGNLNSKRTFFGGVLALRVSF